MIFKKTRSVALLSSLLFASAVYAQQPAQMTVDGLELVTDSQVDIAYIKPGADFSNYTKFYIALAEVKFHKDWERDMRDNSGRGLRISDGDKERIKRNLSDLLYDTFTEELQQDDNFLVVNQVGEDVLILNIAIVDLYITSPENTDDFNANVYLTDAGSMILVGELVDSTSGAVLGRFADKQQAGEPNQMVQVSSAGFNRQEAGVILRGWARTLREGMEEIHHLTD